MTRSCWPALAVVLLAACAQQAPQGAPAEKPAESRPMQERWWNWAVAEPEASNPVADTSGAFCDRNQPDDIWFLAGTFGGEVERECKVPAGRSIVAPLVNRIGEEADCAEFMRTAQGRAELDGKRLEPRRIEAERVTVRGSAGNPVTRTDGTVKATACGLWVTIRAPKPGTHELAIRGSSGTFSTAADYTVEVASY